MVARTNFKIDSIDLLDSHEERISRNEESLSTARGDVAVCIAKIDRLHADIKDNESLGQKKLDKVLDVLDKQNQDMLHRDRRLEALETHMNQKIKFFNKTRTTVVSALAIVIGVILSKFGEDLYRFLAGSNG